MKETHSIACVVEHDNWYSERECAPGKDSLNAEDVKRNPLIGTRNCQIEYAINLLLF